MDKLLLTTLEAAAVLGISRSKLYELLTSGQLPSVRIGACRRVPADAVQNFVAELQDRRQVDAPVFQNGTVQERFEKPGLFRSRAGQAGPSRP